VELVFDNDALWFLVATDLLKDFIEAVGADAESCHRLPTSVFMLKGRTLKKLKEQYVNFDWETEEAVERIELIPALDREPQNQKLIDQLARIDGLDAGEVTLIEVIVECDCRLVTGDMTALAALSTVAKELGICKALSLKIITLCRVLEVLVGCVGCSTLQARCASAGVLHKTVRTVLGVTFEANDDNVKAALESYLGSECSSHAFDLWS